MIIESEVEDIFYTNKKFLKDFKYAITKAYERDENGFPISFNDNGDVSGIKWRLECHLFENLKEETVNSFILNECDK